LAGIALLWPARALGPLDGVPLDGRAEAVLLGVVVPALWYVDRAFLRRWWARAAIVALIAVQAVGTLLLTQQGLCARFSTAVPFGGVGMTIPIGEPTGSLRSWDLRADWRAAAPACTAVFDRRYDAQSEYPAWFVNLLGTIAPGPHDLTLDVAGALTVTD